jgi:hypothetical protein
MAEPGFQFASLAFTLDRDGAIGFPPRRRARGLAGVLKFQPPLDASSAGFAPDVLNSPSIRWRGLELNPIWTYKTPNRRELREWSAVSSINWKSNP